VTVTGNDLLPLLAL